MTFMVGGQDKTGQFGFEEEIRFVNSDVLMGKVRTNCLIFFGSVHHVQRKEC
jgi:hypothetical protein